jgi:hypothetical protein
MPTLYHETELFLSSLGDDTGLIGAIAVAIIGDSAKSPRI